jgi:hypothetical protein
MIYVKVDIRVTVNVEEESLIIRFERYIPKWLIGAILRSNINVDFLLDSQTLAYERPLIFTFRSH